MGTLATTARSGIRSYTATNSMKSALMIRADHLDQILETIGHEFSGTGMRSTRPLDELKEALRKFATKCRKEGLKELGACIDSLAEHPDDLAEFRDTHTTADTWGMWPKNIREMILEIPRHIDECWEAACAIED